MANITTIKVRKTNTVYGIQDVAASLAIEQMKNGTDIDSFGDVETALADKADASELDDYVQKSATAGLLKNDGSVDTNTYAEESDVETALASKQDAFTADSPIAFIQVGDELQLGIEADQKPTKNSNALLKSGTIYDAIDDVYKVNGVLGAKNLYNMVATSKTDQYGGVWTVNNDGTITVSGTPTAYAPFTTRSYNVLPVGNYIFNFNEDNLVNIGLDTAKLYKNGTEVRSLPKQGSNDSFTFSINADDDYDEIRIGFKRILNNVEMSGVIKPMIRLASDPDTTYVPYTMTNKELTLALDGKLNKINGVFSAPSTPTLGDIYNSEEQVVGTWGKQGQEKTLYMSALMSEGNIPFNTEDSVVVESEVHNIANIDEIVFAQFTCKPSSANNWSPLPHKKKYVEINRTSITGYTSNSSNEQAAIKGLIYYTKTS